MMNAVRSASSTRSARSIFRSVPMSTDDVASSSTRMRGSASSARANATSWRCPSDEPRAALAELRLVAVLEPQDELVRADGLRRVDDLVRRAPGVPKAMFSATVPAKRKPSCGTIPSCPRSDACVTSFRSKPSTLIRPSRGS